MSENGLGMIMFSVLTYRFFSIGAVKGEVRGREGDGERERNSSAANVAPCCICGQAVSLQLQMCVCLHCLGYCLSNSSLPLWQTRTSVKSKSAYSMCVCVNTHNRKQKVYMTNVEYAHEHQGLTGRTHIIENRCAWILLSVNTHSTFDV